MPVAIVGCGLFGLATAVELAQEGTPVTLFDQHAVPSPTAALNDLNKIVRCEYADEAYAALAVAALAGWKTHPLYAPHFFECGRVVMAPASAENTSRAQFEQQGVSNLRRLGVPQNIEAIGSSQQLGERIPLLKSNSWDGRVFLYNAATGYAAAAATIVGLYRHLTAFPHVSFVFGREGHVTSVSPSGTLTTALGTTHEFAKVVVACGAASALVVPLNLQCQAMGLFVTHIKLTPEEHQRYRELPIFFSAEDGYFFPPAPDGTIKVALTFADLAHTAPDRFGSGSVSTPVYTPVAVPLRGLAQARRLLAKTVPELALHPLVEPKVCWIADTATLDFLVDFLPGSDRVVVATGDLGHGFKFGPVIGKMVVDRLEGRMEAPWAERWAWRPVVPEKNVGWRSAREHIELAGTVEQEPGLEL